MDINYGSLRPPVHGALLWQLEQTHTIMMMVLIIIRKGVYKRRALCYYVSLTRIVKGGPML